MGCRGSNGAVSKRTPMGTAREDYPIEQTFAKLKALLGKAAERSIDGLWNAIGQLLDTFPADGCARYLAPRRIWPNLVGKCSSRRW